MSEPPRTIEIRGPGAASASISTHGGTLISWKNTAGKELLFVSSKAVLDGSKAIRGGVPVCFPQFGMLGPLAAQHGFARTSAWSVVEQAAGRAVLRLESSPATMALWPHAFQLTMVVEVGDDRLSQQLVVRNAGEAAFEFTAALHTYFRVSHINQASVETDAAHAVAIGSEVDRVYIGAPDALKIADAGASTALLVRKSGFEDAVVWSPWVDKARALADLGDDDYRSFLCLEVAQARLGTAHSGAVTLPPSHEWSGSQHLELAEHTEVV
eukprot:scaffold1.g5880.t1